MIECILEIVFSPKLLGQQVEVQRCDGLKFLRGLKCDVSLIVVASRSLVARLVAQQSLLFQPESFGLDDPLK